MPHPRAAARHTGRRVRARSSPAARRSSETAARTQRPSRASAAARSCSTGEDGDPSASRRKEIGDFRLAGSEIDLGPHEQPERHGLSPELTANLDADDVVVIEQAGDDQRLYLERAWQNPVSY